MAYEYPKVNLPPLRADTDLRKPLNEFEKGVAAFVDETQAMGGGLVAMGAEGLKKVAPEIAKPTLDSLSQWGLDTYDEQMREAVQPRQAPSMAKVEDISSASDFGDWAAYHGAKGLGTLGSLALSGGAGGAVAKAGLKSGMKRAMRAKTQKQVDDALPGLSAAEQATRIAGGKAAIRRGAYTGAGAGAFALEGGSAFGSQVAEGVAPEDAAGPAAAVGAVNAAIELAPFGLAARYLGIGRDAAKKGIAQTIKDTPDLASKAKELAKGVGKAGAVGVAAEGLTEGVQELVQLAGERWAKNEQIFDKLSPEQVSEVANAMAAGALIGGGVGGVVGGVKTTADITEAQRRATAETAATKAAEEAGGAEAAEEAGVVEIPETPETLVTPRAEGESTQDYLQRLAKEAEADNVLRMQRETEADEAGVRGEEEAGVGPAEAPGPVVEEPVGVEEQVTEELTDAIEDQEAGRIDADVLQQPGPEVSEPSVPAVEGGEGVQPEGQQALAEEEVVEPELVLKKDGTAFPSKDAARKGLKRRKDAGEVVQGELVELEDGKWGIEKLESRPAASEFVEAVPVEQVEQSIVDEPSLGARWLRQAKDTGLLVVHPEAHPSGATSGVWDGQRLHVYAGSMPKGEDPIGTVLHEGSHAGLATLLDLSFDRYTKDFAKLLQKKNPLAMEAYQRAVLGLTESGGIETKYDTLETAEERGQELARLQGEIQKTPDGAKALQEEYLAYYVQRVSETGAPSGLVRRLLDSVKAWWAQTEWGQRLKNAGLGPKLDDRMALALVRRSMNLATQLRIDTGMKDRQLGEQGRVTEMSDEGLAVRGFEQPSEDQTLESRVVLTSRTGQKANVWESPSTSQIKGLMNREIAYAKQNSTPYEGVRLLKDPRDGTMMMWAASDDMLHKDVAEQMGIDTRKYNIVPYSSTAVFPDQLGELLLGMDGPVGYESRVSGLWFSPLGAAVRKIPQKKAQPKQWLGMLKKQPGVKQEELEDTGLEDWLEAKDGVVGKDEVEGFLEQGGVRVEEKVLADKDPRKADIGEVEEIDGEFFAGEDFDETPYGELPTKYASYQLPGGDEYRELLVTVPSVKEFKAEPVEGTKRWKVTNIQGETVDEYYDEGDAQRAAASRNRTDRGYTSSHWSEPNVLVHIRFNEREDSQGDRMLFVEEVQSDWHQEGRKSGYATPVTEAEHDRLEELRAMNRRGRALTEAEQAELIELGNRIELRADTPNAPFKSSWPMLGMKRAIRWAAENGFDKVGWTPGEVQAERYDLSKQIDRVEWSGTGDSLLWSAINKDNEVVLGGRLSEAEDSLGKEIAQKLSDASEEIGELRGVDLQVGGEGMKGFYDKMLPSMMNKFGKKYGAKVAPARLAEKFSPAYSAQQDGLSSTGWALVGPGGRGSGDIIYDLSQEEAERQAEINNEVLVDSATKFATGRKEVWSFPITPALRDQALTGMPLYSRVTQAKNYVLQGQFAKDFPDVAEPLPKELDSMNRYQQSQVLAGQAVATDDNALARIAGHFEEAVDGLASEGAVAKVFDDREYTPQQLESRAAMLTGDFWLTDQAATDIDQLNTQGRLQKWQADFIDYFAPLEQKHAGVYDVYDLARSKKSSRVNDAQQVYMEPMREIIAKAGWKMEDVDRWLAGRHIHLDKVNQRMTEDNSRMYAVSLEKQFEIEANKMRTQARKDELNGYATAMARARRLIQNGYRMDGELFESSTGAQIVPQVSPPQHLAELHRLKKKEMVKLVEKYVHLEPLNQDGQQATRDDWNNIKRHAAGYTNEEAEQFFNEMKDDADFQELTGLFDRLNQNTLDALLEGRLISAQEHAWMKQAYKYYAPLRRKNFDFDHDLQQLMGMGVPGKGAKTRAGTPEQMAPVYVAQNALARLHSAIAAAERNKANNYLYEQITKNYDNWDKWFMRPVEKEEFKTRDENGFVVERQSTDFDPLHIHLIRDGKRLSIPPVQDNDRAMQVVRAVNNLDAKNLDGPYKLLGWMNNYIRMVNVSASPAFLVANSIRDPLTAAMNLKSYEEADGHVKKIFFGYGGDQIGGYKDAFTGLKKVFMTPEGRNDTNDPQVQAVLKWEKAGGRISFVESLKEMDNSWSSFNQQVERRQGKLGPAIRIGKGWLDKIENLNIMLENVMRLSTFTVLTQEGVSETRAARIAKDVTTNFTRKGFKTQTLGTLYLFLNATIQGNYQVVRNLMRSPKLVKAVGGMIAFSALVDAVGRILSDDDDNDGRSNWDSIPEWEKERNIHLPFEFGGKYAKIPAPWVFNTAWRAGQMFSEAAAGQRDIPSIGADLTGLVLSTFNPLGTKPTESVAQFVAPTALDPFVQIWENKNFVGNPLGPEGFPGPGKRPDAYLAWDSTPDGYKHLAQQINAMTGGTVAEGGFVDYRPSTYKVLADLLMGGAGRFLGQMYNVPAGVIGEADVKDIPVVRQFLTDPSNDPMESQLYHERMSKVFSAEKAQKLYTKGPDRDLRALQDLRNERRGDLQMVPAAKDAERQIKALRVKLRAAESRGDERGSELFRDRIQQVRQRFNLSYARRVGQ